MSAALRNLLVAVGLTVGVSTLYVVAPGADPDEVRLLALGDGFVARVAEAEFSLSPAGRAWLADAGVTAPAYARLQFPIGLGAGKEADGGNVIILPDLPLWALQRVQIADVNLATCAARPNVCPLWGAARPFRVALHVCAWRPTAGAACTTLDGGNPGVRNTMQPGQWAGAGCQRKACVVIAGEDSSP